MTGIAIDVIMDTTTTVSFPVLNGLYLTIDTTTVIWSRGVGQYGENELMNSRSDNAVGSQELQV